MPMPAFTGRVDYAVTDLVLATRFFLQSLNFSTGFIKQANNNGNSTPVTPSI